MALAETLRLAEDARRERNWTRWGPYLSERQWGTVREDYSADGDVWRAFTHDDARSRAYRWGEDGLLGFTDRECRLCFAIALWNGRDPILKERLFGLDGHEGNHGEDVKECYYFLDSTPTHSYARALYKYPQSAFPYAELVHENGRRTRGDREYELPDTGVFDDARYFDVEVEYAKAGPNDLLIRIHVANRGPVDAPLSLLPTIWFRNAWSWGRGTAPRPQLRADPRGGSIAIEHDTLGSFHLAWDPRETPELLFTENETNTERLWGVPNRTPYVKDAFHRYVVDGERAAVSPVPQGTRAALLHEWTIPAGASRALALRLTADDDAPEAAPLPSAPPRPAAASRATAEWFGTAFDAIVAQRKREADEFFAVRTAGMTTAQALVARQAWAGLLWSKQFYYYVVREWLEGDPASPLPPAGRWTGRNADWRQVHARDVLSMPDSWEYPWFAAWDLAFQMLPFSRIDPGFAKAQLILLLREWYMSPAGQLPAYEFAFSDVNPPVHAWSAWRVYKMTGERGARDTAFLERVFHKLLINFSWWVNRKDPDGNNLFSGGFLGLDNIGLFDRNQPLGDDEYLEQADGTAWMAFYCGTMLSIALELATQNPVYEDLASKFFEHFVAIADASNAIGGMGLWDETDGFYYDVLHLNGDRIPLRIRSIVGIVPLFAVECFAQADIDALPDFRKRLLWFLEHRADLAGHITYMPARDVEGERMRLLAIPARDRLVRVLRYVLDEAEFLSPYGVRSLSRHHRDHPYTLRVNGAEYTVRYAPGESDTAVFGGNSNWRGPIWLPINHLLIEALERYHHFYGDELRVECPTGSGTMMTLAEVATELSRRIATLFLPDAEGRRPCHGDDTRYADDPAWRDLVLFHEHFHGDSGRGVGASHQTGWTALVVHCLEQLACDASRPRVSTPIPVPA